MLYKIVLNVPKKTIINYALAAILVVFLSASTCSSETTRCDQLAALQADPHRTSYPIDFYNLNPAMVIETCSRAITKNPKNASRYLLQRARGHLRAGNFKASISDLKASRKLGYPAATFGLGVAYYLGDNLKRDDYLSEQLLKEAYNLKVIWSSKALSQLYNDPTSPLYDSQKSLHWGEIFNQKTERHFE